MIFELKKSYYFLFSSLFYLCTCYFQNEDIPLADMPYPEVSNHTPPASGVLIYPPGHVSRLSVGISLVMFSYGKSSILSYTTSSLIYS